MFISYLRAKEIIKYIYENNGMVSEIEGFPTDSSYEQELILKWVKDYEFYIKLMEVEIDKWGRWFAGYYEAAKFELKYFDKSKYTYKILSSDQFEDHSKIEQIDDSIIFMNKP